MKIFIKLLGVIMGIVFMGLGVALYKLSSLGQDSLSGMVMSIQYLINNDRITYSVCYISVSLIFFALMLIFLREKINIGTVASMLLCGTFCDLFTKLFGIFNMLEPTLVLKIVYGVLGLVIVSFGIALYGSANLGIAPYDSFPLIITKYCTKFRYKYVRIILDVSCTLISLIVGVLILKRTDIININTILSFVAMGPLISLFSDLVNRKFYHNGKATFN